MASSTLNFAESIGIFKGSLDFLFKVGLLIVSFLAPIKGLLIALIVLIVADLVTGLIAAIKRKQRITSAKLSRTVTKTLVYLFSIILTKLVSNYVIMSDDVPLTSMLSSFIILTELQSVFENLNKISKHDFLTVVIDKLSTFTKGRTVERSKRGSNDKRSS